MELCKGCGITDASKHSFSCYADIMHKQRQLAPRKCRCHGVFRKIGNMRQTASAIGVPMRSLMSRHALVPMEA